MPFLKHQPSQRDAEEDDENINIDPELRLRTVRTAHSTLEEATKAEQRAERRRSVRRKRSRFFRKDKEKRNKAQDGSALGTVAEGQAEGQGKSTVIPGARRNVYVNMPLTAMEVDREGEPLARYVRNKVRTSKYTILTFIPKNLYEQFRRVANLYFLATTVLQVFPVFGATTPQIAMLPLVFILGVTAIKDGIEDYRRAQVDEELNTTATTKLGNWKNVNQPTDPRNWFERAFGLNAPGRVTKGVKKLREREAGEGMRIMLRRGDASRVSFTSEYKDAQESLSLDMRPMGPGGRVLEDIQSVDDHSYPPADPSMVSLDGAAAAVTGNHAHSDSIGVASDKTLTGSSGGVLNWTKRVSGLARWERTLWKKLEVGDVVLLMENDQIPADLIVLSTADPDGSCFIETKNLDGETNLKPRRAVGATSGILSEEDVERAAFMVDSEPPHANLYLYNATLRYNDPRTGEPKQEGVTINELLLRGCTLRNTPWVIGLVAFTGADSKIMLNGGQTPSKRSKIEKETNFNVIVNFVILMIMCIVSAIVYGIYESSTDNSAFYFEAGSDATDSTVVNALVTFVSCLIAFQNIVPISLYISIEIVKTIQAYFISQDVDMYYPPLDTACVPKTWNISDDLGQIEYIFSDKTGTLTQNVMEFQKCSIGGVQYGEAITEAQRGAAKREGRADLLDPEEHARKLADQREDMITTMTRAFKNRWLQPDQLTLISPQLADDMADVGGAQRSRIVDFFRALAICHTVLVEKPEPQREPHRLLYKAESPDEAALVSAARDAGFPFLNRTKDYVEIEALGQPERYTPLRVLEFNSTRKRMSVLVRNPQGRVILYCKGADSVIYERLAEDCDPELKAQTAKDMETFANGGLRTLCIAWRMVEEEEYLDWIRAYDAATSAVADREEEIDKATALIEHSLHILGATALEDKLQEGVPDAIETLHQAGIKLWILTGDKVQTAIEIAYSCNLLKNDMEVMILSADTLDGARMQIEGGLNKMASVLGPPSFRPQDRGFLPNAKASFAVVIDGDTLRHALNPALKELFLTLGTQCETVVCCRVSPAQKALTVKLVKEGRNALTLSIGDGANDVAMIQEANIGIGLFGLEGSQAAMSADYAFGQFRFLTKLLIVHGRWSYRRIAAMHSNFFYKNVIWTLGGFWFLIFCGFSATYLFEYTFILLFNLVFTSLPVIILGAFDQDVNAKAAMAFPQLYIRGIRGLEYTRTKFWLYMADGLYQSAIIFFFPYLIWTIGTPMSWNGRAMESLYDFGTTSAVCAIFAANIYVGIDTHYWTVITWVVLVGSNVVMLLWILIYSFFPTQNFYYEVETLYPSVIFWATVLLSVATALLPRFIIKSVSSALYPTDGDIVREMWVKGDLKDQLGIKHRREKRNRTRSDLEIAPMFQKPHCRSVSELSYQDAYDHPPTGGSTPNSGIETPPAIQEPYVDSPLKEGQTLSYMDAGGRPTSYLDVTSPMTPPDGQRKFPVMAPSPAPSYYSASDIPSPSPLPHPVYRHPSDLYGHVEEPWDRERAGSSLQVPANAYEMRVRSQPSYPAPHRPPPDEERSPVGRPDELRREATDASYATAREGPEDPSMLGPAGEGADWRASTYSTSGPHAM
ncbi:phospholipid-translocating P-type ATPase [Peniophora sp. CONT]|nr:phospholipid-translocating P-type ATPase [Peniophora sp. CONT]